MLSLKQLTLLIYLAEFYNIQGYETQEQADAESHSGNIKVSNDDAGSDRQASTSALGLGGQGQTLEDAVWRYPRMAVEALASLIRVVEENFENFQARAAEFQAQLQVQATKRVMTTEQEYAKRLKEEPLPLPPLPKPSSSFMRRLIHLGEDGPSEPSGPLKQTQLLWDNNGPTVSDTLRRVRERTRLGGDLGY
jgi:hypothetical protein